MKCAVIKTFSLKNILNKVADGGRKIKYRYIYCGKG